DALVGYLMTFRDEAPFDTSGFPSGDSERGKNLVRLSFCISCHAIEGKGGKEALDLGRAGNKLTRAWMLRLLSDTHGAVPDSPMPQYRFTAAQVADVAAYLREELADPSFEGVEADSALGRLGGYWPDEARRVDIGRRLFKELRCGNCHAFPGGEGWIRVGPILSRLGEKKASELPWGSTRFPRTLEDYVWHKVETPLAYATAPHRYKMPTYDFTPEEARDVTIALLAQADLPVLPEAFVVRDSSDAALPLPGEFGRLVRHYRCLSCHSVNGIGHNISYDLGLEGSRVQREWLYRYLKLPYTIRPILTVRMPIFNLTDEEARILADGIADLWRDARIDSAGEFRAGAREVEAGRVLFERSGCRSCHQVGPAGGYVGPSFTSGIPIDQKLRRGWIVRWLQNPQAMKPDVLEPRYGFTEAQARSLAAYLMTLRPGEGGTAP
ncbi:MAG: cytochrome c, partial [Candidatus Eisenbacteria bacterium]